MVKNYKNQNVQTHGESFSDQTKDCSVTHSSSDNLWIIVAKRIVRRAKNPIIYFGNRLRIRRCQNAYRITCLFHEDEKAKDIKKEILDDIDEGFNIISQILK